MTTGDISTPPSLAFVHHPNLQARVFGFPLSQFDIAQNSPARNDAESAEEGTDQRILNKYGTLIRSCQHGLAKSKATGSKFVAPLSGPESQELCHLLPNLRV